MTKQIKILSVAGLIVLLLAGFGIFAATQMNEAPENTNNPTETSEVSETQEENPTPEAEMQEEQDSETEEAGETSEISQSTEGMPTDTKEDTSQNSSEDYETYTNEYYPNLEIKYPIDWNFTTTTAPTEFDGLLQRDITLEKNLNSISISLSPVNYITCNSAQVPAGISKEPTFNFSSGLDEYVDNNNLYFYSWEYDCIDANQLETTIQADSIPGYTDTYTDMSGKNITALYRIETNIANIESADEIRAEVRDIISKSKLQ